MMRFLSPGKFFINHPELMNSVEISKIPDFRTLSYRAFRMDWHEVNAGIIDIIESNYENAAIDSFIVKTCKHTTAQRRRNSGKYKDLESSWGYVTKGFKYGSKTHVAQGMVDAVRDHEYILMDAAYDSSGIYDYIMDNTHAIPIVDKNRRNKIVPDNLTFNREQGIPIMEREKSRYRLRWEMEWTFYILGKIMHSEHIGYVRNRNYDVEGERIVAYNCIVMVNQIRRRSRNEIMDIIV